MALSDTDLAVLNSLMYDSGMFEGNVMGKDLVTVLGNYLKSHSCNDDDRQIIEAAMADPDLQRLVLADVDTYSQRGSGAVTWIDSADGQPYIVFQGTGTGEKIDGQATNSEWYTDAAGLTEADTDPQIAAADYVEYIARTYGRNVVVTGHSNGANKAMYCAIVSPYVISAVAFDGQGFSQAFFDKYADEIAANSGKVTFYGQEGDYVGPLLRPLPVDKHYIKHGQFNSDQDALGYFANNHNINSLFTVVDGQLVLVEGEQSELSREIEEFMEFLYSHCPPETLALIAPLLGQILDSTLGTQGRSLEDLWNDPELKEAWVAFIGVLLLYEKLDDLVAAFLVALRDTGRIEALSFLGTKLDTNALIALFYAYAHGPSAALVDGYQKIMAEYAALWNRRVTGGASGNTGALRDFSDAKEQELIKIVEEVESEFFLDPTRWDVWYRAERWFGLLTIQNYQNDMNTYYRKTIDVDGITKAQIKEIFSKARSRSGSFCDAEMKAGLGGDIDGIAAVMRALI